ncbi:endonuclease/exonuclease/phosphatase family protein [Paucibacter sp. XJ19-41]|uniref:endonuclease/exonuclease/phosphatase family protein n=1 Tax=Paucibacter sp. XJ19-41 TaxID=2927824 RepID=UPI002348F9D2|nr:endonuclease/exonuclease/phosphatase family protein [Paucibacter sp. XJ19-41]MDC6170754.1 endonuclease/exonuclease/phosphatase family protein [Paucibacter sp. XJ19-41]
MQLTLAWWNTGLSPTKSLERASPGELEAAAAVLGRLLDVAKVDFLALGEVSESDVASMQEFLGQRFLNFSVLHAQEKAGRSHFDTSLIYRNQLLVTPREALVRWKLNRATRVAQRFDVELIDGSLFHTYVSHWPSRLNVGASEPDRLMLGHLLRQSIDLALEASPVAPLVLLGDFNDEPFDPVMDNALLTSRDRILVHKTPQLLYNPFWRHMTSYEHTDGAHQFSDRGTYFHASGQVTRWRTFDQMMFSASLVNGESGWMLDEMATRVLDEPALMALIESKSSVFDHLPIVGRLIRNQANG